MLSTTARTVGIACTIAAALAVSIAPSASAKGGDGTRVAGTCSSHSTSLLKAKLRDGRLEVEFEIDQNRNQVPWHVQLLRNGKLAFAGTRTTAAPSGSFSIERKLAAGTPVIRARATRNGETCTATLATRATAAAAASATAPALPAATTGVKLRGDGTVDDTQTAAPAPADAHRGGNTGSGGADDSGHHGSDD